jgi:hypothetical protein
MSNRLAAGAAEGGKKWPRIKAANAYNLPNRRKAAKAYDLTKA